MLEPFEAEIEACFANREYLKFVITDDGLEEADKIRADARFRDYYLSRAPSSRLLQQ